jgi:hypothetical protein
VTRTEVSITKARKQENTPVKYGKAFHGTGEKGPVFLCNPPSFVLSSLAKLKASKFRVFVIGGFLQAFSLKFF